MKLNINYNFTYTDSIFNIFSSTWYFKQPLNLKELDKTSTIKVIGSGVQVLPPTYQTRVQSIFCADDSHSVRNHFIVCTLDHVTLKSWLTWKAFSCSPWQTTPSRAIFFSFWLVLASRNGFEEILKCSKIKLKTDSICLKIVTFWKRKIKCLISRVDSHVTSFFMQ